MLVPIPCMCTPDRLYQNNASYMIQFLGETYFIIANITYQGLTTCQALIAQNLVHDSCNLIVGDNLTVLDFGEEAAADEKTAVAATMAAGVLRSS
jgi:hypothetical protein